MSVFSQIIAGDIPGRFVWADDVCVAIATHEPITDGHVLVIPREETSRYTDLDDVTFAHISVVAKHIGSAQIRAFDVPRAMTVIAGLEVPHVHIHVIPARSEADIHFANARSGLPPEEIDAAIERLRDALRADGWGDFVPAQMSSP
ncbi:MAG: HIT family protein [Actinomycetaceae bacterium]|nr:HIT family protein [Actinomycetaceae bacterium]